MPHLLLAVALAAAAAGQRSPGVALPDPARAAVGVPAAPPAGRDRVVRLRFAWKAPLRARVTYRKTRVGPAGRATFVARYDQHVEADGAGLRIRTRGISWSGDVPFPRALARDAIRASESVVQRVGAGGEFMGLEGVEALRPVLARAFEDAKVPPEAADRAVLLALGAMRAEAEEAWNLAVGFWTGADLALGETYALESSAEIPLLPGVQAQQAIEFEVRRRVPCTAGERAPRCVEVTLRATPDRAEVERASAALLSRVLSPDAERPEGAARDLSVESELVLVTDPETLLPRRVVWTKAVRLAAEDGPARAERIERSEWDYSYAPPPPPRRPKRRPDPSPTVGLAPRASSGPRGRRDLGPGRRPARRSAPGDPKGR